MRVGEPRLCASVCVCRFTGLGSGPMSLRHATMGRPAGLPSYRQLVADPIFWGVVESRKWRNIFCMFRMLRRGPRPTLGPVRALNVVVMLPASKT